ncbi:hypothetical protein OC844_003206, partial [Tilletia horrida]
MVLGPRHRPSSPSSVLNISFVPHHRPGSSAPDLITVFDSQRHLRSSSPSSIFIIVLGPQHRLRSSTSSSVVNMAASYTNPTFTGAAHPGIFKLRPPT